MNQPYARTRVAGFDVSTSKPLLPKLHRRRYSRGGYTNKIRDSSLCGGALREDSFEHVNTRSMRENIDWIAGVSHPAPTAQIIRPFAVYNVGRSAPPDPYNIKVGEATIRGEEGARKRNRQRHAHAQGQGRARVQL